MSPQLPGVIRPHFFRLVAGEHFHGVEETRNSQMKVDIFLALVLPEPAWIPVDGAVNEP